ncbi:diacylglycerol kinase family protein [Radiobacillus sp. PE A8.2]|uniref:diacylglycerol kinase family protein n=1 Tax=Radiobacillus sp. PE A8.2 TaxID=3380349 RepID=UPI00388D08E1
MHSDFQGSKQKKWIGLRPAFHGLMYVTKTEKNFRIQLVITVLALLSGLFLRLNGLEWVLLSLTIGLVLALELANTAIEQVMNHLSPDFHPIVGRIKDISAGAVLVTAVIAIVNGCILFLPKIIALIW